MGRASREVWIKRIERGRDSGLGAKEFAEQVGVEVDRLRHWKWRLAKQDRATNAASAESTSSAPFPFVEVTTAPALEREDTIIEVVAPSGFCIRVPARFRRRHTSSLARGGPLMLPASVRIFVCTEPQDMRRSFNGLALATTQILGKDPVFTRVAARTAR